MKETKERSFYRDRSISIRRRIWGPLSATDIDWLEYGKNNQPVCLIEQKSEHSNYKRGNTSPMKALQNMAKLACLPLFGIVSQTHLNWIKVFPLNDMAKNFLQKPEMMSEEQYVSFLYRLRGLQINEYQKEKIKNTPKPDCFCACHFVKCYCNHDSRR